MYKYRDTSYVSNKYKKAYRQSTLAKMKDQNTELSYNNNTMTGCISTEAHQMNITRNRLNGNDSSQ